MNCYCIVVLIPGVNGFAFFKSLLIIVVYLAVSCLSALLKKTILLNQRLPFTCDKYWMAYNTCTERILFIWILR